MRREYNLRKMEEETRKGYIEKREKGFKCFTYLGEALDSIPNIIIDWYCR